MAVTPNSPEPHSHHGAISRRAFQRSLLLGLAAQTLAAQTLAPQLNALAATADDLAQPLAAQLTRLLAALEMIGEPLAANDTAALRALLTSPPNPDTVERMQHVLRPYVLLDVTINPEGRVSATRGAAKAVLVEQGWRSFLVRVTNQAHDTSVLTLQSAQAQPMGRPSGNETVSVHDFTIGAVDQLVADGRWLGLNDWTRPPLAAALSGLELEYRIVQLYSRDAGTREASLEATTGVGEQDLGFRSTVAILFTCLPSRKITLNLREGGRALPAAALRITDSLGRIYPAQAKRALPDLWFQPQIYRFDQESITLPLGHYTIESSRGPEYTHHLQQLEVSATSPAALTLAFERWITPAHDGYFSGDTHIHAAGCSHYESPSEGVTPGVMLRQVEGEALDLGAVLTWAPGFLYQSQFFSGHVHPAGHMQAPESEAGHMEMPAANPPPAPGILRYDLEVSGFPSSHCGHLVLLNLRQQNYPNTRLPGDWPSWNLPILKWAKSQGAITGYAHSGHGMATDSIALPNTLPPAFSSCGANEYLVDITHPGMLDFISGCDLWPFVELNLWYHVLNCGFPLRFAGETDFPCITDHCVGGGRTYVHLPAPPVGDAGYTAWLQQGLQTGRSYFGDGRSHIAHLTVENAHPQPAATHSLQAPDGSLSFAAPATVRITAIVAARLEPEVSPATLAIQHQSPFEQPFWHLERARLGATRTVPVELIVNGEPRQRLLIQADGTPQPVSFDLHLDRSSWLAVRILPSSHTNPVIVTIAGQPVRASVQSAHWCRTGIDVLWAAKSPRIREAERPAAARAYDHARSTYDRILAECPNDALLRSTLPGDGLTPRKST